MSRLFWKNYPHLNPSPRFSRETPQWHFPFSSPESLSPSVGADGEVVDYPAGGAARGGVLTYAEAKLHAVVPAERLKRDRLQGPGRDASPEGGQGRPGVPAVDRDIDKAAGVVFLALEGPAYMLADQPHRGVGRQEGGRPSQKTEPEGKLKNHISKTSPMTLLKRVHKAS